MKTKLPILFGMIFLMLITSVFAQYDWKTYGSSFSKIIWNSEENGIGKLNTGIVETSISSGTSIDDNFIAYQPIVNVLNDTAGYIIIQNGNYLQVYDKNLNLLSEKTENAISQLSTIDWDFDGLSNDIVGIFEITPTIIAFRVYNFNINTYALTKTFEYNFTTDGNKSVAGLRNIVSRGGVFDGVPFVLNYLKSPDGNYSAKYIRINNNDVIQTIIPNSTSPYYEPLSIQDVDNDGNIEYMTYSKKRIVVFREDGTIVSNIPIDDINYDILSARLFNADLTHVWKIVYYKGRSASADFSVIAKRLDGSTLWTYTLNTGSGSFPTSQIAIVSNYDSDTTDNEIFVCSSNKVSASQVFWRPIIIKGKNGNILNSSLIQISGLSIGSYPSSCTIADMNNNGKEDFIMSYGQSTIIHDMYSAGTYYNVNDGIHLGCVPADVNFDGNLEVVCSGTDNTKIISSNYVNQIPTISQIVYDPSILIQIYNSVNAYVTASDTEGDTIIYAKKCFNGDNWTESSSSIQNCYYGSLGTFNFTIGVRDIYHSTYTQFSQSIIVSETGAVCGNGICEAGETNVNCPADCPTGVNITQATEIGGMPLPTKIVDVDNMEQGLLPEIYYGTLAFLSGTLTPMIVLVFLIFFVLIIFAVGFIIKKIAHRVGDLAR